MRVNQFREEEGFTLIDVMIAVMLVGILAAMATFQIGSVRPGFEGDGAMRVVMSELNTAREMAITQRRHMRIDFVGNNTLRVTRINVPTGTTLMREVSFESGVQYGLISGIGDTPDAYGNGSATTFSASTIMFGTDGALINPAGGPVNGTVFLAKPGFALSFRAVTVQGTTGRVRAYRWVGNQWRRV